MSIFKIIKNLNNRAKRQFCLTHLGVVPFCEVLARTAELGQMHRPVRLIMVCTVSLKNVLLKLDENDKETHPLTLKTRMDWAGPIDKSGKFQLA